MKMPTPVSAIDNTTKRSLTARMHCYRRLTSSVAFDVSSVNVPPFSMASRALTMKLTITCSSWPGSALIKCKPAWRRVST